MRIDILGPVGSGKSILKEFIERALEAHGIRAEQMPGFQGEHSLKVVLDKEQLRTIGGAFRR